MFVVRVGGQEWCCLLSPPCCMLLPPLFLLSSIFCSLSSVSTSLCVLFIISTSITPYKQWLVGRLVVLCDIAVAAVAEVAVGGVVLLLAVAIAM